MTKVMGKPSDSLYPLPVMLVSCADRSGKKNMITLAWVSKVSVEPPLICIAVRPSRHSHPMIKDSGEFVVNVPNEDIIREVDLCGNLSDKNVDKFAKTKFTTEPGKIVKAPIVQQCPANYECVVRHVFRAGTHDLFVGEVVAVHFDESILSKNGGIDYQKAKPVVYAAPGYWTLGRQIGSHGYSTKD